MIDVKNDLKTFINENFIMGRIEISLTPEISFIESGIMDSTGILELITFIEEKYSITIDDEELVPENLDSLKNLINFLKKKGIE
jgi:acyl carrier protein